MNLLNNAVINTPRPINEPVLAYAPGSPEKTALKSALAEMAATEVEIPLVIAGQRVHTGDMGKVVMPHDHQHLPVRLLLRLLGPVEVPEPTLPALAALENHVTRSRGNMLVVLQPLEQLVARVRVYRQRPQQTLHVLVVELGCPHHRQVHDASIARGRGCSEPRPGRWVPTPLEVAAMRIKGF